MGTLSATGASRWPERNARRLGFTIFMLEMVAQVAVTAVFYDLMKPVNRTVAGLSAIMGLTGRGIKTMARLFYYAPLILIGVLSTIAALGWLTFLWPGDDAWVDGPHLNCVFRKPRLSVSRLVGGLRASFSVP